MKNIAVFHRIAGQAGYTIVEAGITVFLIVLVSGFALMGIDGSMPGVRANAALSQTVAEMRRGRELAMAQRRDMRLEFIGKNKIQLTRMDLPIGTTTLRTVTLENKIEFTLLDGIPDTPDSFGNGSAVDFGGASPLIFLSDGSLVDSQGNPISGSVFLGMPGRPETARAATILGSTGRIRGYKWTGTSWTK